MGLSRRNRLGTIILCAVLSSAALLLVTSEASFARTNDEHVRSLLKSYRKAPLKNLLERPEVIRLPYRLDGTDYLVAQADENPALQKKIDDAADIIFSTPTGISHIKRALRNQLQWPWNTKKLVTEEDLKAKAYSVALEINFLWAISGPRSRTILERIFEAHVVEPCYPRCQMDISLGSKNLPPKAYFFVADFAHPHFLSYTARHNATFIWPFAHSDADRLLLHVLAHEIAITSDMKTNLFDWVAASNKDQVPLDWKDSLTNPVLSHIFAIIRAFVFESRVISELERMAPRSIKMPDYLRPYLSMSEQTCRSTYREIARFVAERENLSPDQVQRVESLLLNKSIPIAGSEVESCLHFAEPEPAFRTHGAFGPRPRRGDW